MNRILIATGDAITAESILSALSNAGFRTATVWDSNQLIAFCRQHHPDLVIIDLALPGGSVWTTAQTLQGDPATAGIPFVGLGDQLSDMEIQQARSIGFARIERKENGPSKLLGVIRSLLPSPGATAAPAPQAQSQGGGPISEDHLAPADQSVADKLRLLIDEILELTSQLKPRVPNLGPEGPELFGYIEGSGADIDRKLAALVTRGESACREALYDKDVRHDFRNMIGSVTGFAELILMEPVVPQELRPSLTRIRECSRIFVDLLDQQKEAAAA